VALHNNLKAAETQGPQTADTAAREHFEAAPQGANLRRLLKATGITLKQAAREEFSNALIAYRAALASQKAPAIVAASRRVHAAKGGVPKHLWSLIGEARKEAEKAAGTSRIGGYSTAYLDGAQKEHAARGGFLLKVGAVSGTDEHPLYAVCTQEEAIACWGRTSEQLASLAPSYAED